HRPYALIEHVEIEAPAAEQRHPVLQFGALRGRGGHVLVGFVDLPVDREPGEQPALAVQEVVEEIAEQTDAQHRQRDLPGPLPNLRGQQHCRGSESHAAAWGQWKTRRAKELAPWKRRRPASTAAAAVRLSPTIPGSSTTEGRMRSAAEPRPASLRTAARG